MPDSLAVGSPIAEQVFSAVSERLVAYDLATGYRGVGGRCLATAVFTWGCLAQLGRRVVLQAGDMSWPIAPPDTPAPEPTHLSYQWDPGSAVSMQRIVTGGLPEIHVWVGVLEPEYALVDMSVGELKKMAGQFGLTWRAPDPPAYLWASDGQLPSGVRYEAKAEACGFLFRFLMARTDFCTVVAQIDKETGCELQKLLNTVRRLSSGLHG